ncbi:H-NS family nucleoid-associated regulatory protein [Cupriavidus sp. YR651]|uniref:H-NS histone family protein n=1 Tax=Cupriavidus sp. YR651 TaxID=1855315 RepID=UPI0021006D97|nr:H-NS family nucleoid-associated regulatory protein [Cupriavidus sp. YR651]
MTRKPDLRTTLVDIEHPSTGVEIRARAEAILWIKSAVARHGITLEQLEQAGCFAPAQSGERSEKPPKYKDAAGRVWNGLGVAPEWLQRAINAGQSMEHFRIS